MAIPNEVTLNIVADGRNSDTFTEIDGVRIPGVHTVALRSRVGETPSVAIELYTRKITAKVNGAEVGLALDDIFRQLDENGLVETTTLDTQIREYTQVDRPLSDDEVQRIADKVIETLTRRQQLGL